MMRRLTADDFVGEWRLEREIADRHAIQSGTMVGQAVFLLSAPERLDYAETGILQLAQGPALTAQRRYFWQFGAGGVQVFFQDGRPFHDFIPHGHATGTDHPCGEDYYTVRYDFTAWPLWTAVWTVKGPRKDYVSTSVYRR